MQGDEDWSQKCGEPQYASSESNFFHKLPPIAIIGIALIGASAILFVILCIGCIYWRRNYNSKKQEIWKKYGTPADKEDVELLLGDYDEEEWVPWLSMYSWFCTVKYCMFIPSNSCKRVPLLFDEFWLETVLWVHNHEKGAWWHQIQLALLLLSSIGSSSVRPQYGGNKSNHEQLEWMSLMMPSLFLLWAESSGFFQGTSSPTPLTFQGMPLTLCTLGQHCTTTEQPQKHSISQRTLFQVQ